MINWRNENESNGNDSDRSDHDDRCARFSNENQPSAFALTAYQSGFEHGLSDGKDSCTHSDECHWYIL
jgi:hypothetical protein